MFPETDELSKIISGIIKIMCKRRLVDRVLRLWTEMARGQGFPGRDQIEPSKLGADWRNCLVIGVQFPVQLSYLVAVGENLSFAHCHVDSLADVLLSYLPQVLSERRCLMIEGRARLREVGISIGAPFTRYRTTVSQLTMCWAQQATAHYAKMNI